MGELLTYKAAIDFDPNLNKNVKMCVDSHRYPAVFYFNSVIIAWYEIFLFSITPFILLFIFNVIIIVSLRRAHLRRQSLQAVDTSGPSMTTMTYMMITAAVAFFVLNFPGTIESLLFYFGNYDSMDFAFAAAMLRNTNNSINFILYCLSGRKFRNELRNMFSYS